MLTMSRTIFTIILLVTLSLGVNAQTVINESLVKSKVYTLHQVDSVAAKGVLVYSNKGCGRCVTGKELLKTKEITFDELDLGEAGNREVMLSLVSRAAGKQNVGAMYPIIVYKDLVLYGQEDMAQFIDKLKARLDQDAQLKPLK